MTRIIQIERWGRDGIVALCDDGQLWIRPFERGWEKLQGPPVEESERERNRKRVNAALAVPSAKNLSKHGFGCPCRWCT